MSLRSIQPFSLLALLLREAYIATMALKRLRFDLLDVVIDILGNHYMLDLYFLTLHCFLALLYEHLRLFLDAADIRTRF